MILSGSYIKSLEDIHFDRVFQTTDSKLCFSMAIDVFPATNEICMNFDNVSSNYFHDKKRVEKGVFHTIYT